MNEISERALVARINRSLSKTGERLRVCREASKWFDQLGRFYCVNNHNRVSATHVNMKQWAKELKAI